MSDSAMIVSSHDISEVEFQEFIVALGGWGGPLLRAAVSEGQSTVWIGLLRVNDYSGLYDDYLDDWARCLGGRAITVLEMQLDHTEGARDLYLRIAYEFGRLWKMFLVDIDDSYVPYELVRARCVNQ